MSERDNYADAVLTLDQAVERAIYVAETNGLEKAQIVKELRYLADSFEAEES